MDRAPRSENILSTYVTALIRVKARQLVRSGQFPRSDEEDLRQELTLRLLQRARRYDPTRAALNTFAERVVCSLVATLLREQRRQKSSIQRSTVSIEFQCDCSDEGATPLRELLHDADQQRRTGAAVADPLGAAERAEAIHSVVADLPPELRAICQRLMRATATETARELGISRHQVQKAIATLRDRFTATGLN
jgi:RNA polymerase sigma factor (sigma-70 family)